MADTDTYSIGEQRGESFKHFKQPLVSLKRKSAGEIKTDQDLVKSQIKGGFKDPISSEIDALFTAQLESELVTEADKGEEFLDKDNKTNKGPCLPLNNARALLFLVATLCPHHCADAF